jgi:hypothetical protein
MSLCAFALALCTSMQMHAAESAVLVSPLVDPPGHSMDFRSAGSAWGSFSDEDASPAGASPVEFLLNFATSFVPEDQRRQIVGEVWGYVKGVLHRTVEVVSERSRCRACAYILLGTQGRDTNGDGVADAFTTWDDADYDNDGQFDSDSGRVDAATAEQVARDMKGWMSQADSYLRGHGM